MFVDTLGKINEKRLPHNNALLPLFEAVANSIFAIEQQISQNKGLITIDIIRSNQTQLDYPNQKEPQIIDFIITDNGIGFNEDNFDSFNHAHSTYKKNRGGKGLGRFTYLRSFSKVEVDSIFKEDEQKKQRKFEFLPTKVGVESHSLINLENGEKRRTIVHLKNLHESYWKWYTNDVEDIAFKIIEHCFISFLSPTIPIIIINDKSQQFVVNDYYNLHTDGNVKKVEIEIMTAKFTLSIARLYKTKKPDNKFHYVANYREVENRNISDYFPELDNFLYDKKGEPFSLAVFIEGAFLDERVDADRIKIEFDKEAKDLVLHELITEKIIAENIIEVIKEELKENLETLEGNRQNRFDSFFEQHPQYRKLQKYKKKEVLKLSSRLTDDKLELEMFKLSQELDLEIRKETDVMYKQIERIESTEEYQKFKLKHADVYTKIIDVGNSKLSEYVLYRKFIIDFLDKHIKINEESKFTKEDIIHNLIFPMKTDSDEIGYDDHNLWLLDERLAFHYYLASDKLLKQNKATKSNSADRPDLIIFNRPFAFVNNDKPYSSIVIVEFKRPMRDDYNDDDNPIQQVTKYARNILENKVKDKYGREFELPKNTPIYAYIISDLTNTLRDQATDATFTEFPDRMGYFNYNANYSLYTEIIGFDKLIRDSKHRNKAFFDKLNIMTL